MKEIIEVNGVRYDAITGQRISEQVSKKEDLSYFSEDIHSNLQRSNTLNRKFVKRPDNLNSSQRQAIERFKNRHDYAEIRRASVSKTSIEVHRSTSNIKDLRRKSSLKISPLSNNEKEISEEKNQIPQISIHPIQQKAIEKMREQKAEKILPSAKEIKDSAIVESLEKMKRSPKKQRGIQKKSWISRRMASFLACCMVIVLGLGYLTYLNAPEISVKIAAIQSGVDASSPQYVATGYSMKGMARFDGETVNLTYSNGINSYTLKQAKSSWDSVALLENYVEKNWDNDYSTYQEKGLTIYEGGNDSAVWVNNGKLYMLNGNNKLSNEDIRKIATSL